MEKYLIYNIINKIYFGRPRGPQNAGPVAIATFATIVNPALGINLHANFKEHCK